jgi:hypothetical protein
VSGSLGCWANEPNDVSCLCVSFWLAAEEDIIEESEELSLLAWKTGWKFIWPCDEFWMLRLLVKDLSSKDKKGERDWFCPYVKEGLLTINTRDVNTIRIALL